MAINKEVFRVRALSSLFFVIAMLAGLLWNQWSFLVLFSVIHFGCWWEYLNLISKIHRTDFHFFERWGVSLMGWSLMLAFCGPLYRINDYGIRENFCLPVSLAGFLLLATGIIRKKTRVQFKGYLALIAGLVYISLSCGAMIGLRQHGLKSDGIFGNGAALPLLLILAIWANDTFAYLVGSMIGKTPFSKISPKKTWEGTAGGAILCVVGMGTLGSYLVLGHPSWDAVWIALLAAVVGTMGDLLESKLKRMAGVKDSGNMLPGHGGFMDRFDSLLLTTPFVWVLAKFLL